MKKVSLHKEGKGSSESSQEEGYEKSRQEESQKEDEEEMKQIKEGIVYVVVSQHK